MVVVRRGGVGGRVNVLLGEAAPRRGLAAAAAGEGGRRRCGGVARVSREEGEGPHGWAWAACGGRGRRERGGERRETLGRGGEGEGI